MKSSGQKPKRKKLIVLGILLLCAGGAFAADYWAYPYGAAIAAPTANTGDNGLWLQYTWYFGRHSIDEERDLAAELHDRQVKYAYFHVRSVDHHGKLVYRYPTQAKALTSFLHRQRPDVKLLAWMYIPNDKSKNGADLANTTTRLNIIEDAAWLVKQCGFDGVQLDAEPVPSGDNAFLALVRDLRTAFGERRILSVATPVWQPVLLRHYGWSGEYFRRVAEYADQVAVMCYDTLYYSPRMYVWLVRQQAIQVSSEVAMAGSRCRVMLGVPAYGDGLISHNPRAENVKNALRGVREGLADSGANRSAFAGVALFADYTCTSQDWSDYNSLWLDKQGSSN